MERGKLITMAALAAALSLHAAGPARGQDGSGVAAREKVAPIVSLTPAREAADANAAKDDLDRLLEGLSNEDIQRLVRHAVESRLTVERQQVVQEIKEDLLADPDDIDAAVKIIETTPANTQKDNIDRIARALAKVDPRFGKAHELLKAGKHAEAAEAIKKDLNVQEATYRSAARYTLYARALAAGGKSYDAVDAYQKVLVNMADRISLAAAAALESARIYEGLQRFTYASQMYQYALTNYGLTLDADTAAQVAAKLAEYDKFGKDPLAWAGTMMGQVKKRLDAVDSGKQTQKTEEQIIAVITDLIKTAEEQQQGGQGQGQGRKDQKKGKGKSDGQAKAGGSQGGPKGNRPPSNPAQVSTLVPGAVARPTKRSEVRDTSESGDWSNLPPRERQKLQQLRRKIMSERYRSIIGKYRARIAERRVEP